MSNAGWLALVTIVVAVLVTIRSCEVESKRCVEKCLQTPAATQTVRRFGLEVPVCKINC